MKNVIMAILRDKCGINFRLVPSFVNISYSVGNSNLKVENHPRIFWGESNLPHLLRIFSINYYNLRFKFKIYNPLIK
jgi:hypothetical protein